MNGLTGFQLPEFLAPGSPEWWAKYSASQVAAICGLSDYDTPRSVHDAKTGIVPPQPQTAVMGRGHEFEPLIRGWVTEANPQWSVTDGTGTTWQHEVRDWQIATPDALIGIVVDDIQVLTEILEIKTAQNLHEWGDTPPLGYIIQCMWLMDVIGAQRCHLAACGPFELFNRRPKMFVIEYNPREAAMLRERVLAFDAAMQAGIQPAADHTKDSDRLAVRYASRVIRDDPGVDVPAEIAVPYLEAFAAEASVAEAKKATGSTLLEFLGESKKATFRGITIATRVNGSGDKPPSLRATNKLADKAPEILAEKSAA
ncbi:hypothetical protein B2J88_07885 [Rhodococcus sp. SRB_17]|nr:hypothetical protein [Rhodococcus sp. SRB_17]